MAVSSQGLSSIQNLLCAGSPELANVNIIEVSILEPNIPTEHLIPAILLYLDRDPGKGPLEITEEIQGGLH